jgi:hypothetical protein
MLGKWGSLVTASVSNAEVSSSIGIDQLTKNRTIHLVRESLVLLVAGRFVQLGLDGGGQRLDRSTG